MASSEFTAVFNASGADFARVGPRVWEPAGQSLVYALRLRAGENVLDVCSGAGASAIPAARAVGPTGRVHAIDLADDLLEQGRLVASDWALQNVDFVTADATAWERPSAIPDAGYDALACSYGVFFLPHMDSAVSRLVRLVRPYGRVGVTVWRAGSLDEFTSVYFDAVREFAPTAVPTGRTRSSQAARDAADRLNTPDKLTRWLEGFGLVAVEVHEMSNFLPATDDFAWGLVLGSALRGPLVSLDTETVTAIRTRLGDLLVERGIHTVDAGTLVGTGVVHR